MQERILSKRIMHFTVIGVHWESQETYSSEAFPLELPPQALNEDRFIVKDFKKQLYEAVGSLCIRASVWDQKLYQSLAIFVSAYSKCSLTVESDNLVAVRGIVQEISRITGDRFFGGIWGQYLLRGLLWRRYPFPHKAKLNPPRLKTWRAPSWSWASVDYETWPSGHLNHTGCHEAHDTARRERGG